MADWTGPLDTLRAVNLVLKGMGEPSINTLLGAGLDAQSALETLQEASYKLQVKGWHWNKERHTLSPDNSGNMNLPQNIAKVDTVDGDKSVDVVQRGFRLFNQDGATYTFTRPLKLEIYVVLPFEELPATARLFVTASAAMTMQQQLIGSDTLDKDLQKQALDAWQDMMRDEIETGDYNMLTDSWSVGGIISRDGQR